ncbi:glyoxalase [Bryobacterales bacterium F-183]|nr:glyoxalase [Bryobacterales bacterium F-183]
MKFDDGNAAFAFYQKAFGATEVSAMRDEAGRLRHGELRIGDSPIMMSTVVPEYPELKSAITYGGSPMSLFLYVDDADAWFERAVANGCKVSMPMADQSYGRTGGVLDPFGYTWWITTHKE